MAMAAKRMECNINVKKDTLKTYWFRLREEVVDPGDAPHALEVLLCLDGDGADGSSELPSCHCHLDTGLRT